MKKGGKKKSTFSLGGNKNVQVKVGHLLNNKKDEADDGSKMAEMLNCF